MPKAAGSHHVYVSLGANSFQCLAILESTAFAVFLRNILVYTNKNLFEEMWHASTLARTDTDNRTQCAHTNRSRSGRYQV